MSFMLPSHASHSALSLLRKYRYDCQVLRRDGELLPSLFFFLEVAHVVLTSLL